MLVLYLSRNFAKLVGLECPEPLANLYSRSYFRATWITTALDAGFWSAMGIRQKWLRDISSFVFSIYYLIAAEQADEKVRKVRATLTVDHMRVSWNKATTPYLSFFGKLLRPRLCRNEPMAVRIPRPRESSYKEPTDAWLYFDGPLSALRDQTKIVLDIPGGGFVAMNPRTSDDKLLAWAGKTGVPILSLDYKKAPEHPYPYALNECYDVYHTIVTSRGRCLGLSGEICPKIIITGDSSGGNLGTGLTLMILQSGSTDSRKWRGEDSLPPPAGLVLIYPTLDMNIGSWMTDEQMSLIRQRGVRKTNRNVLRRKSEDYYKLTPATPHPSDDELGGDGESSVLQGTFTEQHGRLIDNPAESPAAPTPVSENPPESVDKPVPGNIASQVVALSDKQPHQIKTRLAVSSMISYFNDRILTPEMMRAMIILYVGPHNRPDFSTDFLLSPLLAPEALLAQFPKTYFLTGERDPLVDDTVIFAGRLRQAKLHRFRERQELGLEKSGKEFDEKAHVEVTLIPGISHGFLNFVSVFPEGWRQVFRGAAWIQDLFAEADIRDQAKASSASIQSRRRAASDAIPTGRVSAIKTKLSDRSIHRAHHRRGLTGESSGDDDGPLEMSMLQMTKLSPSPPPTSVSQSTTQSSPRTSPPLKNGTTKSQGTPPSSVETVDETNRAGSAQKYKSNQNKQNNRRKRPASISLAKQELSLNVENLDDSEADMLEHQTKVMLQRKQSLTSLPSEEDLLNRRMNGLAGGLMGIGEEARTP